MQATMSYSGGIMRTNIEKLGMANHTIEKLQADLANVTRIKEAYEISNGKYMELTKVLNAKLDAKSDLQNNQVQCNYDPKNPQDYVSKSIYDELQSNLEKVKAESTEKVSKIRDAAWNEALKATADRNNLHEQIIIDQNEIRQREQEITVLKETSNKAVLEARKKSELHQRACDDVLVLENQQKQIISIKQEMSTNVGKKQQKINELESDLEKKAQEIAILKAQAEKLRTGTDCVKSDEKKKMNRLMLGNKKLQKDKIEAEKLNKELEMVNLKVAEELQLKDNTISEIEGQRDALAQINQNNEAILMDFRVRVEYANTHAQTSYSNMEAQKQFAEAYRHSAEQLQNTVTEQNKTSQKHHKTNEKLQRCLSEKEAEFKKVSASIELVTVMVKDLEKKLEKSNKDLDSERVFNIESRKILTEKILLQDENNRLKSELAELKTESETFVALKTNKSCFKLLQDEHNMLKNQFELNKTFIAEKLTENGLIVSLNTDLTSKNSLLGVSNIELSIKNDASEISIKNLNSKTEKLLNDNRKLMLKQQTLTKTEIERDDYQVKNMELVQKVNDLEKVNEEALVFKTKLEQSHVVLEDTRQTYKSAIDRLNDGNENLLTENSDLKKANGELLTKKSGEFEGQKIEFEEKLKASKTKYDELHTVYIDVTDEVTRLEDKIEDMEEKVKLDKENVAKKNQVVLDDFNRLNNDLMTDIKSLKNKAIPDKLLDKISKQEDDISTQYAEIMEKDETIERLEGLVKVGAGGLEQKEDQEKLKKKYEKKLKKVETREKSVANREAEIKDQLKNQTSLMEVELRSKLENEVKNKFYQDAEDKAVAKYKHDFNEKKQDLRKKKDEAKNEAKKREDAIKKLIQEQEEKRKELVLQEAEVLKLAKQVKIEKSQIIAIKDSADCREIELLKQEVELNARAEKINLAEKNLKCVQPGATKQAKEINRLKLIEKDHVRLRGIVAKPGSQTTTPAAAATHALKVKKELELTKQTVNKMKLKQDQLEIEVVELEKVNANLKRTLSVKTINTDNHSHLQLLLSTEKVKHDKTLEKTTRLENLNKTLSSKLKQRESNDRLAIEKKTRLEEVKILTTNLEKEKKKYTSTVELLNQAKQHSGYEKRKVLLKENEELKKSNSELKVKVSAKNEKWIETTKQLEGAKKLREQADSESKVLKLKNDELEEKLRIEKQTKSLINAVGSGVNKRKSIDAILGDPKKAKLNFLEMPKTQVFSVSSDSESESEGLMIDEPMEKVVKKEKPSPKSVGDDTKSSQKTKKWTPLPKTNPKTPESSADTSPLQNNNQIRAKNRSQSVTENYTCSKFVNDGCDLFVSKIVKKDIRRSSSSPEKTRLNGKFMFQTTSGRVGPGIGLIHERYGDERYASQGMIVPYRVWHNLGLKDNTLVSFSKLKNPSPNPKNDRNKFIASDVRVEQNLGYKRKRP